MMNRRDDWLNAMNDWLGFPRDFFEEHDLTRSMKSDVAENDRQYEVKIDMPGLDKKDINISYNNDVLTVAGTHKNAKDLSDKEGNLIRQERSTGRMARSYRLPNVDLSQVHAKYEDGVLDITLPKVASQQNDNHIEID